ncbi:hypothetical protein DL765_003614 [Monosporascus sp. GIB2]|nr:hypothetical protein DL765_003614 [Monosporascus sp. GIB2]
MSHVEAATGVSGSRYKGSTGTVERAQPYCVTITTVSPATLLPQGGKDQPIVRPGVADQIPNMRSTSVSSSVSCPFPEPAPRNAGLNSSRVITLLEPRCDMIEPKVLKYQGMWPLTLLANPPGPYRPQDQPPPLPPSLGEKA